MLLLKVIKDRLRSMFREQDEPTASDILLSVAHYFVKEHTTTASFQSRGFLLPEHAEALSIVIRLQMEARK